ncbi:SGNH/GDSL hydrolase family protein [Cellulomonas timonensis]
MSGQPVVRRLAALIVLLLAGVAAIGVIAAAPRSEAATPVRVMALGDSITGSPGCWRALLWQKLQQNGHTNVDMVGTLPAQGCGVAYDGDNEGHGGFLVTNVADQNQLVGWLAASTPDVVMMHFGTNDVWSNRPTDQILAAYTKLVDQMRASNPNMKILVAKIIPVAPSTCAECPARTVALNNAIPGWAASKTTSASPITVVDQWTGWVPATDTYDGVHPSDPAGITKMANVWYPALTAVLNGVSPTTPNPTAPDADPRRRLLCRPDPGQHLARRVRHRHPGHGRQQRRQRVAAHAHPAERFRHQPVERPRDGLHRHGGHRRGGVERQVGGGRLHRPWVPGLRVGERRHRHLRGCLTARQPG